MMIHTEEIRVNRFVNFAIPSARVAFISKAAHAQLSIMNPLHVQTSPSTPSTPVVTWTFEFTSLRAYLFSESAWLPRHRT